MVRGLAPTNDGIVVGTQPGIAPAPMEMPAVDEKGVVVGGARAFADDGVVVQDVAPQQVFQAREALWPKSVATWLILSVIFIGLSVQLVSPTRRWRFGRRRRRSKEATA